MIRLSFVKLEYCLGFLILIFGVSFVRNYERLKFASSRVEESQVTLARLEAEKESLERELSSVSTQEYVEKQARDKLMYAYENEVVLVLPDNERLRALSPRSVLGGKLTLEKTIPNWRKWFLVFF